MSKSHSNRNSFSVLSGEDDAAGAAGPPLNKPTSTSFGRAKSMPFGSPRTSGDGGGSGGSSRTLKSRSGRSLADLAAQQQSSSMTRSHSTHASSSGGGGGSSGGGGRRGSLASAFEDRASSRGGGSSILAAMADEKNVIRYTREKLLSMRPRPDPSSSSRPATLESILGGTALLSDTPLDPGKSLVLILVFHCWFECIDSGTSFFFCYYKVCYDTFDADEIWQAAKSRGGTTKAPSARSLSDSRDNVEDRKSKGGPGRWQRGIALPPAEDSHRNGRNGGGGRYDDADHPEDLWDDPVTPQAAAADFSAFGGSLDDEPRARNGSIGSDSAGFDLGAMSEMSKKFDQDIHGSTTESGSESLNTSIDPLRPLADAGTTIKSGSGDDVNVFEDFASPEEVGGGPAERSIRSGDEEQNASSRLMQMIGVTPEAKDGVELESSKAKESVQQETAQSMFSGFSSSVPSNPWGDPIIPSHDVNKQNSLGLDLSALTLQREQEEEEERRRLLEEKKRQQAQQEAELQRQQALRTQQQAQQQQQHEQVERILTERVSGILENSWGRCELTSILQTLHSEDPRVIPLLGTVDALRALLSRHPLRIRLAKDPTFGAEMAVLQMTNSQWQQRASEETQRRQQEEQQKLLAQQQQAAAAAKAKEAAELRAQEATVENVVITDSPWFYADPQGNVQVRRLKLCF